MSRRPKGLDDPKAETKEAGKAPLVLSVTSGKGGVGKTSLSVNLAYCLTRMGKNVLLLDADLGLANVDVMLGLNPEKNLFHLFQGKTGLEDILVRTKYGFTVLPAASGIPEMVKLSAGQKLTLLEAMDPLENRFDFMLVDTGAGAGENVIYFNLAAQKRLLVLTPEPTSLTDAYAMIKVLTNEHGVEHYDVVVNMVGDMAAAKQVFAKLYGACDHFLSGVSLDLLGYVPKDNAVKRAVTKQTPFCHVSPDCAACGAVKKIAADMAAWETTAKLDGNIKFFWKKLLFHE